MKNKICLITGATSGIGRAAASEMAKLNYDLILTGRSEAKGLKLAYDLGKLYNIKTKFYKADISSLNEVRQLSEKIIANYQRIDVLINNAGLRIPDYQKSTEGIELTFATNHLGHFYLTVLLMSLLKNSESARIINVSSSAHPGNKIDFDDIVNPKQYDRRKAYGQSKLANVLFTYELARRLSGTAITANAMDPGGVATNFARNEGLIPFFKHKIYYLLKRKLLSPRRGAETIIYLASSPEVHGVTGKYFYLKKEIKSSSESYDTAAAKKLWDLSLRLCGMDDFGEL